MPASCSRCSADLSQNDIDSGLVIRVAGALVCAACIDALNEGGAQVAALRGIAGQTYSVRLARLPGLKLYTFTTSGSVSNHRRALRAGTPFPVVPLPRPELLKAQIERARATARSRKAATGIVIGAAVLAVAIGGAVFYAATRPSATPDGGDAAAAPVRSLAERYGSDPFASLTKAIGDPACSSADLRTLTLNAAQAVDRMLVDAQAELDAQRRPQARSRLRGIPAAAEEIMVRRDIALAGKPVPTLLYGYGGFDISLTPAFSAANLAWVEAGGAYVVANLRGGGEYGEKWHLEGNLLNKQNCFDDFAAELGPMKACGETSTERLAIEGGSNDD